MFFWRPKERKAPARWKGFSLRQLEQRMVKRSTGVARTVWVAKSECCQKQYYSNIGFLTWLKLLPLALCVNKFPHINIVDFFITRSKISNKLGFCSLTRNFPPLAGNYLCKGILRELYAYNGNIKEKPAPLKDTAWSLLIFGLSDRTVRPLVRCSPWRVTNWGRSASPKNQQKGSSDTIAGEQCLRRREL